MIRFFYLNYLILVPDLIFRATVWLLCDGNHCQFLNYRHNSGYDFPFHLVQLIGRRHQNLTVPHCSCSRQEMFFSCCLLYSFFRCAEGRQPVALSSIYSLALIKSDKTASAIVKLSAMMRYVINEEDAEFVSMEKSVT
ncbi:MAG: histidine kinase [Chryseolinea sp.]